MKEDPRPPLPGFEKSDSPLDDRRPSIYLLEFSIPEDITIDVGSLGEIIFRSGRYIYVGSAKSGLYIRARRHLGSPKSCKWHIDYLNRCSMEKTVWRPDHDAGGECRSARILTSEYEGIPHFGSSDCECSSHLFFIDFDTSPTKRSPKGSLPPDKGR